MSDVIARMRLESQDFDNKLKSATANLQHMEREVRRTGATFEYADKEELAFLESLGSMQTKAMDAKGRIKELSNSYKELAMMYERMTAAEKSSDAGKTLANSLQKIKAELNTTKQSFESVSKEIGEGGKGGLGGALETLGSKIGIPAGAFTALGGAMAAGAAAAKVAKDAFLATEGGMDTWGAAVESAKGAYSVFLDTLNNGNWGSFFTNLKNAITGANDLYDAMDRLGSIKANNAAAIAKEQATIQELRLRQQKGENVAAELRAAEERLRKLQNESVDQGKVAGREQMKQAITNSASSMGNGGLFSRDKTAKVAETDIDAAIEDILANGQAAMDKYAEQAEQLYQKALKTTTQVNYSPGGVAYETTKTQFDWSALTAEEQQMYKLAKAITDTESTLQQGISTFAQATSEGASSAREAFQTERFAQRGDRAAAKTEEKAPEGSIKAMRDQLAELNKEWELAVDDDSRAKLKEQIDAVTASIETMTGKAKEAKPALQIEGPSGYSQEGISAFRSEIQGSMKGMQMGSDEYMFQADRLVDLTAFENLLKTATENGIQPDPEILEKLFETIDNAEFGIKPSVPDEAWEELVDDINDKLASKELPPITLNVKTGGIEKTDKDVKALNEHVEGAIGVFGQLGSVMQQIDDPAARVAGIIMEAVASVASAFAKSLSGTASPWDFIAGAIAGVGTMISTIAAIKSATQGFASGGMVEGNSYSGDNIVARLNAGEGVLTQTGVQTAAAMANNSNPLGGLALTMDLKGEDIQICLDNNNRRRGRS